MTAAVEEAGRGVGGGGRQPTPRSTAYYYGDLERLRRGLSDPDLSDAKPETPAFRQRSFTECAQRQQQETYSTAGTFPLPRPGKEKEPLLAELEVVGRLPLVRLSGAESADSGGVRRSSSWYLCCPTTQEEETSGESSWRYSSLRPVTAPPAPHLHLHAAPFNMCELACAPGAAEATREVARLRRALSAERARAAAEARAHDARLAELHGVIAELVRRRDRAGAIPEEESEHSVSEACESSTQPAGELELERDADRSRTDLNDSSSLLSPAELPAPRAVAAERKSGTDTSDYIGRSDSLPTSASPDNTDHIDALDSGQGVDIESRRGGGAGARGACRYGCPPSSRHARCDDKLTDDACGYDTSLHLSERESSCGGDARDGGAGSECCRSRVLSCAEFVKQADCYLHTSAHGGGGHASAPRVAARVRLRRAADAPGRELTEGAWSAQLLEKLAGEMRAQGELGEALAAANCEASGAALAAAGVRAERLLADACVLEGALADAKDTAERLWLTCALHESWSVCLCNALRAADRALETYDVLLALAESQHETAERGAAELVARRLLARLEADTAGANTSIGEPMLSPGPWLHTAQIPAEEGDWSAASEARLRAHAARLKSETAAARSERPPQPLHAHSLLPEGELPVLEACTRQHDMETAVLMAEVAAARQERGAALAALAASRARAASLARALSAQTAHNHLNASETARVHTSGRGKSRRAAAAETNL